MNASKLVQHLLERSCARGIEVIRDEVAGLVVENGRLIAATLASGSRIDARVFVLAAGPLLPEWTDRLDLDIPIFNELHGKIAFEDNDAVIPRDAPLMIWNDAVDLGPLGTFPSARRNRSSASDLRHAHERPAFPRRARLREIVMQGWRYGPRARQ
jgi:glycine/D-amino acid oxidase-like deaminating enzyme